MVQAPMPLLPIEHGQPGPGLLAHVLVSKSRNHLPLYRQSGINVCDGVELVEYIGKGKARTNVAGVFPNETAVTRLVGAILTEQNDERAVSRGYITLETLAHLGYHEDIPMALAAE